MSEYKVREYLLKNNSKFNDLFIKHQECEQKLANLNQKSNISSEDVVKVKILKKKKLSLKDSMQRMIITHTDKISG